jgi:amino acid transporter
LISCLLSLTTAGDEVKHVRTRVPRSIILTCVVNSIMLITFATVLLFYLGPLEDAMETPLPILWVIYGATGSKTVSNVLMALMAIIFFLAAFNIFASVSRLVWVFAKDNGLPFSSFFARVGTPSTVSDGCLQLFVRSTPVYIYLSTLFFLSQPSSSAFPSYTLQAPRLSTP